MHKRNAETREKDGNLPLQFVEHGLHLADSMAVAAARSATDASLQPGDSILSTARRGESLRGHEVARRISWIVGQQRVELGKCRGRLTPAGQFHRQSIAGKTVL